jgi:hypothetical protein
LNDYSLAAYRVLAMDDNQEIRRKVTNRIYTHRVEIDVLDVPSMEETILIRSLLLVDLLALDFSLSVSLGLYMVTGVEDAATHKVISM